VLSGCGKTSEPTAVDIPMLDETAPPAPQTLSVDLDASGSVNSLKWSASSAPDVSAYDVWMYSPDPSRETSYVKVWSTSAAENSYMIDPSGDTTVRHFRVGAVDASGNHSPLSASIAVEVGPPHRVPDPSAGGPATGHLSP
jgi:hypothetical protein